MLASAKINLALHVTGKRDDGYHLLDSFVVFAGVGDQLSLLPGAPPLMLTGRFAGPLMEENPADNLITKAARLYGHAAKVDVSGLGFELEKNLPVASGIGGGSADCAAALHLLNMHFGNVLSSDELAAIGLKLGADVPVCLQGRAAHMQGIGEALSPVPPMPRFAGVLINPGVPVPTGQVFAGLTSTENPAMEAPDYAPAYQGFIGWLSRQRNDLQAPAMALAPEIGAALAALEDVDEIDLVRMSGSGATVFGLCENFNTARAVASALSSRHPAWWVQATDFLV